MMLFNRLRVGPKLILLAGFPVLGILALSVLVVIDVQERTKAAAGLGSIEELAQLTERMLRVIDELQWERAEVTFSVGIGLPARPQVHERQERTNAALGDFAQLVRARDKSKLPPKLRQDLDAAQRQLEALSSLRTRTSQPNFDLLAYLEFFAKANDSLIAATAALSQLSEDKQLLLAIGGLVSAMQVIERNAREHALLNYVFAKREFPPGSFRYFVTLLTEQHVYVESLRTWASEEEFSRLAKSLKGPFAEQIQEMRQVAIETTEDTLSVDPERWFDIQSSNLRALVLMERDMAGEVRRVASEKIAAVEHAVRLAIGLVLGVVATSLLIGWAISRGLTRSVRVLFAAAEGVHKNNDFGIRAEKTSSDELGLLTDAFNGMLAGIQERDRELGAHRQNLESLVEARTRQLSEKNEEMALVLDNVDQGLAMIDRAANLIGETSRTFKEAFGAPASGTPFYRVLCKDDELKSFALEAGFEQLVADVLPLELALDQLPKSLTHDGRHYSLAFTPVKRGGMLTGALLVARDITLELLARRADAEQRERVSVFERIMRDRTGFQEFFRESRRLMTMLNVAEPASPEVRMRTLHTLKGVMAVFDVSSVAEAAHELEQALDQGPSESVEPARKRLLTAWEAFRGLVAPVVGEETALPLEISREEIDEIIERVRTAVPHAVLLRAVVRLTYEPVAQRLRRIEEQIKGVARRLNKPEPLIVIDADDVRVPPDEFRPFWSSLTHVVRNMADHGFELEADRLRQGKLPQNRVELRAAMNDEGLIIELADDGAGIDWERLATKARQTGLPAESRADLTRAIFADGVSTREAVTQTSGRGVGMSAVLDCCVALGGSITVESETGRGTRFRFFFSGFGRPLLETKGLGSEKAGGERSSARPRSLLPS
jgi:two-component system chemotaxis sensor kinase CheA